MSGQSLRAFGGNILTKDGIVAFVDNLHDTHGAQSIAFCLFIMFASMWIFEFGLHFLREKFKAHKHLLMLFHRTTDELMVMGLTSLMLFVISLGTQDNSTLFDKASFELLHICLFFAVLLFMFFTAAVVLIVRYRIIHNWQHIEAHLLRTRHNHGSVDCVPRGTDHYVLLRRCFIEWNQLNQDFLFSTYLKDAIFSLIKEVIEFDAKMWIVSYVFLLPLVVDYYYIYGIFVIVVAVFIACFIKTHRIKSRMESLLETLNFNEMREENSSDWEYYQSEHCSIVSIAYEIQLKQPVGESTLYWFGCPRLFRWILHFTLLMMAITLAFTLVFFRGNVPEPALAAMFFVGCGCMAFVAVYVLPVMAECLAIGRMVDLSILAKCAKGKKNNVLDQPMRPRGFTEAILKSRLPRVKSIRMENSVLDAITGAITRRKSNANYMGGEWNHEMNKHQPLTTPDENIDNPPVKPYGNLPPPPAPTDDSDSENEHDGDFELPPPPPKAAVHFSVSNSIGFKEGQSPADPWEKETASILDRKSDMETVVEEAEEIEEYAEHC